MYEEEMRRPVKKNRLGKFLVAVQAVLTLVLMWLSLRDLENSI